MDSLKNKNLLLLTVGCLLFLPVASQAADGFENDLVPLDLVEDITGTQVQRGADKMA